MILTMAANTAHAQGAQSSVDILVERMSPDAESCGVTEQAIYGAANSALRYNRVRVGPLGVNKLTLYININTQRSASTCAINARVSLKNYQETPLPCIGHIWANVVLCDKGALGIGRGGPELNNTIKDLVDSCLADTPPKVLAAVGI